MAKPGRGLAVVSHKSVSRKSATVMRLKMCSSEAEQCFRPDQDRPGLSELPGRAITLKLEYLKIWLQTYLKV